MKDQDKVRLILADVRLHADSLHAACNSLHAACIYLGNPFSVNMTRDEAQANVDSLQLIEGHQ
jgi:hypothetical protein